MLKRIDDDWPQARNVSADHFHWEWRPIGDAYPECFCVIDDLGDPAAIWASYKTKPIKLPDGRYYRADRIEVSPRLTHRTIGSFAFSLIAVRALELQADGIVLGAIPAVAGFYANLGGENRLCDGWETDPGLEPFVFEKETLLELKEEIDELVVEKG